MEECFLVISKNPICQGMTAVYKDFNTDEIIDRTSNVADITK